MDGNKRARGAEKAAAARSVPPAAPSDDADATSAPARVVRKTLPVPGAAAPPPPVDDDEPVAAVDDSGAGAGVVEDDDDEQVERFYALLANIRALRGLVPPPYAAGSGATTSRKRAAEPPWRPAFRMEDFEDPAAPPPSTKRKRAECADDGDGDGNSASGARPVLAVAPSPPHAAERPDSGSYKN